MQKSVISWKLIALIVVGLTVAGLGIGWLWLHAFNIRASIDAGVGLLRDAGPWGFFAGEALLPAIGFPISIFHLSAGSAFAAQMGIGGVIAATGVAVAINLSLTYWLARFAFRPFIVEMISRTKYRVPVLSPDQHTEITLLVRITPGPPYFMQGYLLGLADVRFGTYLWISWVVQMAFASGFVVFGDAILQGKGGVAFIGLSALAAVAIVVHFVRKHYGKKRT